MAKKKITEIVTEIMADFLQQEGYELWNTEFVKEGKDWFLRVYIDKYGDEHVGTEDCEKVSRFLSDRLDEDDPIEQNYYLEVSSPGMDRPLLKLDHYMRYIGSEVEVKLYKGKDGKKNIQGILNDVNEDAIKVTDHDDKVWDLTFEEIARTKLAVVF